jgi:hypothetical protein
MKVRRKNMTLVIYSNVEHHVTTIIVSIPPTVSGDTTKSAIPWGTKKSGDESKNKRIEDY